MRFSSLASPALILVLLIAITGWHPAGAKASTPDQPTSLTVSAPQLHVAQDGDVQAHLVNASGEPISNATIEFFVDGESNGRERTDVDGNANHSISHDLPAGSHLVEASFSGATSRSLAPSYSTATLTIEPATVEVQTVPSLPGMQFTLAPEDDSSAAGMTATADADGVARFSVPQSGVYLLTPAGFDGETDIRAVFSRWQDNVFEPQHSITIEPLVQMQAGFEVSYLVSHDFVNAEGVSVSPERVDDVTFKSTLGGDYELNSDGVWLVGWRPVRSNQGLEAVEVQYSLQSVLIDGTNVVSRSEQRFFPSRSTHWQLEVKLFNLDISAKDAILGLATGDRFKLTYPDGHVEEKSFGPGSHAIVNGLARGDYKISVVGSVYAKTVPISMTRDQTIQVKVIGVWDVLGVLLVFVGGALTLLLIGRTSMWRHLLHSDASQETFTFQEPM